MLFPRVLPFHPFGLYCVFRKGINHKHGHFNIMADDFVRLRHTKNNTLCDIQHTTPGPRKIPTIVLDYENLSHHFPLHNVEVSRLLSLKKVTTAEVQNLPQFDSEHHCTSRNCIVNALDIDILSRTDPAFNIYDYLDLALYATQKDKLFDDRVLQTRAEVVASTVAAVRPRATIGAMVERHDTMGPAAQSSNTAPAEAEVSFTPLRKVLDLMKASPSKVPPPTAAGIEVFDSSVVEYGPVKTQLYPESTSSTKSGGHTPNTSISSTFSEKIHQDSKAASYAISYPKAFEQSEMPFAGSEAKNKMQAPPDTAPASSSSDVLNQASVMDGSKSSPTFNVEESVPGGMNKSGNTLMEAQEEKSTNIKKSQRKKGRERKAAQALKKEQQVKATALSADHVALKKEALTGSASSTAPLPEGSTVEAKQNDDDTAKESQQVKSNPVTKSQKKRNRRLKGKAAKEMKQQQEPAPAASKSSSSDMLNVPDSSKVTSQDQAESETFKQPDQGKKASNHAKPGKKAAMISKSALLAKANGTSLDNMPNNKAKTQFSLGSLVQPGRPRPKASAMPEPELAKLPILAEFSFEAPGPSFNTHSRNPQSTDSSSSFGNITNPGQPRSGSSSPPLTKPITPPSLDAFDPVFASPPPKINFNVPPCEQTPSYCRLRLADCTVKAKELASVQNEDAATNQTAVTNRGAASLSVPFTSEEVAPAQMTAATAGEHIDQSQNTHVDSETATGVGIFIDGATKCITDEEPQLDKEPQIDQERKPVGDVHDLSTGAKVLSDEQASPEAKTDQQSTLAQCSYDKRLYEFSDDEIPSDPTLPQNRPDHVDDVAEQFPESEQAAPEPAPVSGVQRGYDPTIYELSEDERPTDPTMPQNRPDRLENVVDNPLSIQESTDEEHSKDSTMPQDRSDVLVDVATDSPSEDSLDRYVLTAEDENRLETLNEALVNVLSVVAQQKKSESSSRVTSGSLSVTDGLGSLPSITSIGTRTGDNTPSDPAQIAKDDAAVSTSPAALDGSSLSANKGSEIANGTIQNIDVAQSISCSTSKELDRAANPLSTTSSGLPKDRTNAIAEEVPAIAWAGKQAFYAVKVAAAVTLLPVNLAVQAAMVPVRNTKMACLITRWAISRFGPSQLANILGN